MSDTTPGEIAYAAFWAGDLPDFRGDPWETMDPLTQARWEAAAQAVLAWQAAQTLTRDLDPDVRREEEEHPCG